MKSKYFARAMAAASFGLLASAGSALASGGVVQSATATPFGYSLSTLALDTAPYNVGVFLGSPSTPPAPSIPFNVVEGNETVNNNTYLYLPIYFADNSIPFNDALSATFPASVASQTADAVWLDNYILQEYGVSAFIVEVDGTVTTLTDAYITGVNTPTLLDGPHRATDASAEYISIAAVLSPLSYGTHTVAFGGIINGSPTVFGSSTITSVPEPTSLGLLGVAGLTLMRRNKRR